MNEGFDVNELLGRITEKLLESDSRLTEESACEKAKTLLKGLIGGSENISALADAVGGGEYKLPDGSLLQVGPPSERKTDVSPETREKLDRMFVKIDGLIPPAETVRLRLSRGKTTVFDSKMGGVPYFPREMPYPTVRKGAHAGKPLRFLAQLNFGELPKTEGFPSEGILQFFAGFDDDEYYMIGMDFDDGCGQNGFRVIYHESVIDDVNRLLGKDDMPVFHDTDFPVKGEFLLTADDPVKMPVTPCECRFDAAVLRSYNELFGAEITKIYDDGGLSRADEALYDALYGTCCTQGTRMGGYPYFTQSDPRYKDTYSRHTVLLFQSDTEWNGRDQYVEWGDSGVANFFITPEDLARRDFSNVLYNWDCC